jgi:hypothetical protein
MALERLEAAKRPLVAGDCELEPVSAWIVAADGEARSFEALGAAVARLRLLGRDRRTLLGGVLTAGEDERCGEDEARANSRRR